MCLADGIESREGRKGVLLRQQLCTVTFSHPLESVGVNLTRKSDGTNLGGGFHEADLASAAGCGTLLHLALVMTKPIFVKIILEQDPSAAAVADGAGRLPLQVT